MLKQYFGLSENQLPFIIIETIDRKKYLKANLKPLQIADWMKDYMVNKINLHIFWSKLVPESISIEPYALSILP